MEQVLSALETDASLEAEPAVRASPLREFAGLLLARASSDFLEESTTDELVEEVKRLYAFAEETPPDEISVRVRPLGRPHRAVVETVMPDCSFIVNTLREYVHGRDFDVPHLLHPVVVLRRASDGRILQVEERGAEGTRTSVMYLVIEGHLEEDLRRSMEEEIRDRLESVRVVNRDFSSMMTRAAEIIQELGQEKGEVPWRASEFQEIQDLLAWLQDGHFVFLGYRAYDFTVDEAGERWIGLAPESGLGILQEEKSSAFRERQRLSSLPADLRARVLGGPLLVITKTNSESPVHRRARMDYIGIKRIAHDGEVVGERRFLGLFTSKAYNQDALAIPILRRKLREILEAEGAVKGSHDYQLIFDFFGSMPLEELFLSSVSELSALLAEVRETEGVDDVRVSARPDPLARGVNVMVILPKQRFSAEARRRIQEVLVAEYRGTVLNYHLALGEGDQARLHFYIASDLEEAAAVDVEALERTIRESVRSWDERLSDALKRSHDVERAHRLADRHQKEFSAEYKATVDVDQAVEDIERLESLSDTGRLQVVFEELREGQAHASLLKVFTPRGLLVLSDVMPVLENLGFRVLQADKFDIGVPDGREMSTIHTFDVETPAEWEFDREEAQPRVERAFRAIIERQAENDRLNSLVLSAGLEWREVALLRAYAGYAFRSGAVGSRLGVRAPLTRYPRAARLLFALFEARLDPRGKAEKETLKKLARRFHRALVRVRSIEDDRTYRRLLALVRATVRTNYFQAQAIEQPRGTIALKFNCSKLDFLPRPRPRFEVYVSSPYTEGAHLRMDAVARGGIRWSDRYEDYRVEVLGLVKTQQVKNALIVPAGAKGAFIVKRPLATGIELQDAAVESYKEFIGALLDLTDDIRDGEVVHPPETVTLDGNDPYLVVAADKGTAALSDTANALATERGFWLGDAFASGGSRGYDHKALAITARGAWECVRRHFRELGVDIQKEPFTVAGIGDMSGDVFGNGMLLSHQIRLVAAFDHRHIFIDPDPDPEESWEERKRLFEKPGSTWADYDAGLLSEGGRIYDRGAKRIDLAPQARALLQIQEGENGKGGGRHALNGEDVVRAIMRAPVDLLFNGGVGTYVKATAETNAEAGDRANDAVRIDASELRARVVGEGGNLGLTQRARIEYALAGGRLNTDAIDNSGGVDLSDHEVNVKILLNAAMERGELDEEARNRVLEEVTDDVVAGVLENSRSQSLALSLDERRAREAPDEFRDALLQLERVGGLDRALEDLPTADEYNERIDGGAYLTRPELAVMMAYAKMHLKRQIQRSELADDRALLELLRAYFPQRALASGEPAVGPPPGGGPVIEAPGAEEAVGEAVPVGGGELIAVHPLRSRLVATELTNRFVDWMGSAAHPRLMRETGRQGWEIARAWYVACCVGEVPSIRDSLVSMEAEVPAGVLYEWYSSISGALERSVRWLLANADPAWSSAEMIGWLAPVWELRSALSEILPGEYASELQSRCTLHEMDGLSTDVAADLAGLENLEELLPVVRLARRCQLDVRAVGGIYFGLSEEVEFRWLRDRLDGLPGKDLWTQRAAKTLRLDLERAVAEMTAGVLTGLKDEVDVDRVLTAFRRQHRSELSWIRQVLEDVRSLGEPTLPALMVAVHAIRQQAGRQAAAG
ncbi:MAG: NAD-glutamate dehydrogenase [Gemmatimonadetes bacterium]|nr:NAD-glutamate dehydrogenase [Gemmatimonadota bacterium]